ncbi:hypothetical protein HDC92_003380 [Pedobacter sp. AK017]|uniref:polysaccharide lyase family 8 super-sandwich domain-containing protein n=1 Tax=Pedobacter sp. AK017 TaxID=2723073 RepID=UPI0016202D7F|nr:polysaccharide lyase family 8 super-sandwich domain-containing protein [Pedobacter sp. AK017]MBB5439684.1 hypothetical protein [Pedobacter sp. AK017]
MKLNLRSLLLAMLPIFGIAFGAAAQTLLSLNKPASASTTEGSYFAANAVDNNTATYWSSTSNGYIQTLTVDLGSIRDIDHVVIQFADGRYAVTFDIQGSTNGITWNTLKTIPPTNSLSLLTINGTYGWYRYIRFNGRGRANTAGYRISDFKVYGDGDPTSSQQADMDTVAGRLISQYSKQEKQDLTFFLTTMLPNGQWPGVNYTGDNWPRHTLWLNRLAQAYRNPSNVLYNHPDVPAKFMLAMRHFINANYVSSNWHDNEIRSPNNVVSALLLMRGAIPNDSLMTYAATVVDQTDNSDHRGANRSWVSTTMIRKGLVMDSYKTVTKGYQSMVNGLNIANMSITEGIRMDSSFHQHRTQIQTGSYGMIFVDDEVKYLNIAAGTSFNSIYTTTYKNNLRGVILGGLRNLSYRNTLDFGIIGRSVSGANSLLNKISAGLLDTQAVNDPVNNASYQSWKAHLAGAAFPFSRAKHFWLSDMVVSRGANFYMSAKITSSRNTGTEAIKGTNLKGWNLPFGATNILVTGNEYDNIFPSWNWSRIPGTTSEMSEAAASTTFGTVEGYVTASNVYGGGLSVNEVGIIAFQQDNKRGVTANKAYFLLENMMVCVGNSITASKSNEIVTTINQTKLDGAITIRDDGSTYTFSGDSLTTNKLNWVNHGQVGYLFPNGGYFSLTNKSQTGTWASLGGGTGSVTNQMFNLYVRHSPTPTNRTYYYIVAPNKSAGDMTTLYASHGFELASNTSTVQAIYHNGTNKQYAAVFYGAGQVTMPDGLVIKSDKKAIVQVKKYSTNYRISVSDPEYTGSNITITLNLHLTGAGTSYAAGETAINLSMYSGDEKGKTNTGFYNIVNDGSLMAKSDQQNNEIMLYPNPATSTLTVKGVSKDAKIEVYDLWGRKYKTVTGNSVEVSELQNGPNYFLRIYDKGKVIRKQFIKE